MQTLFSPEGGGGGGGRGGGGEGGRKGGRRGGRRGGGGTKKKASVTSPYRRGARTVPCHRTRRLLWWQWSWPWRSGYQAGWAGPHTSTLDCGMESGRQNGTEIHVQPGLVPVLHLPQLILSDPCPR